MSSYEGRGKTVLNDEDTTPMQLTHPCYRSVTCREIHRSGAGDQDLVRQVGAVFEVELAVQKERTDSYLSLHSASSTSCSALHAEAAELLPAGLGLLVCWYSFYHL